MLDFVPGVEVKSFLDAAPCLILKRSWICGSSQVGPDGGALLSGDAFLASPTPHSFGLVTNHSVSSSLHSK